MVPVREIRVGWAGAYAECGRTFRGATTTRQGGACIRAKPKLAIYARVAMTIRVVLADDSYIVREGVSELLRAAKDIEVVATCSDLDSLEAAVEREHPDVVVTDIRMPPTNTDEGIRMAERLRRS